MQEADLLHACIQRAAKQLAEGLAWLAKGLPLNVETVVQLVTCSRPGEQGQEEEEQVVAATLPAWESQLVLAQGATSATVWVSCPLGPGRVHLRGPLLDKAATSGLPCCTHMEVVGPAGQPHQGTLRLELHWAATAAAAAPAPAPAPAPAAAPAGASAAAPADDAPTEPGTTAATEAALPSSRLGTWLLALFASLFAAAGAGAWWGRPQQHSGPGQLPGPGAKAEQGRQEQQLQQQQAKPRWVLTLLRAELVRVEDEGSSLPYVRSLSITSIDSEILRSRSGVGPEDTDSTTAAAAAAAAAAAGAPSGAAGPPSARPAAAAAARRTLSRRLAEGEALPAPLLQLVAAHPNILTDDKARRFLVGLGSVDGAVAALERMVRWVESEGVVDLVHRWVGWVGGWVAGGTVGGWVGSSGQQQHMWGGGRGRVVALARRWVATAHGLSCLAPGCAAGQAWGPVPPPPLPHALPAFACPRPQPKFEIIRSCYRNVNLCWSGSK